MIGFDVAGNRTFLNGGDYVSEDWLERFGVTVSAVTTIGGFTSDGKARIFDTSDPVGDIDLGSPN